VTTDVILPVLSVLAGVGLTFAGTGVIERQKWRRSRAGDRQDHSRRALTEVLQTVTQVIVELRRTAEQIELAGVPDRNERLRTVDDLVTTARRQATAAYVGCSQRAFTILNEVEREMQPVHVHLDRSLQLRTIEDLHVDADVLVAGRNRLINELRREDELPALEDVPVSPRRTRQTEPA